MKLVREENNKNYKSFINHITKKKLLDGSKEYENWGNIPIEVEHLEQLYNLYEEGKSFIDLGCGVGNVLRYAKNIGYVTRGIEINTSYKKYLKNYNVSFIDITKMDLKELNNYDVVYSYKPLKGEFKEFVKKVKRNMKSGATLITPHFNHDIF